MTRLIWLSFVLILMLGAWRAATPQANADNKLSVYMTYVDPNDGHLVIKYEPTVVAESDGRKFR